MKSDVLTLAAVVFIIGMLVSSLGMKEVFQSEVSEPPAALQQGVVIAQK